ncbi:MAG: tagaturonate reductase [Ruminococcaceae bacterium]|nr:tagaturonate reductase [Oscillospiraceae bacterium]
MNYNKPQRTEKIIQFGEGNFLRGFVDWILQTLNKTTNFNGSAVVVQPIENGMCDMLSSQDCVYNLVMRGLKDGKSVQEIETIDSISRTVNPYADYDAYISLAHNKDARFVVSNTTESGIAYNDDDDLLMTPPTSFPAKVTALLLERYKLGYDGFIFLPCELIDKNGETLKSIILKYADRWQLGDAFKKWVNEKNIFCNTLVDRIVTGYPKDEKFDLPFDDKMIDTCEIFHLWVIEGPKSILSEIPFDKCGLNIIITDNLENYRTRKVRILNGAHTAMIPYALLSGVETVGECMKNETISNYINSCVFDEIIPTLDLPEEELNQYAKDVFERFNNPFIRHACASIALNSVSKFKVRVLPSILEFEKRFGKLPEKLLFSFAKLIDFYKTDMTNDAPEICEFMKKSSVSEILANTSLWDADLSHLCEGVEKYIGKETYNS